MQSKLIKLAQTKYPILDLFKHRFSARSFKPQNISENDLNTILEAASWAASANNEQPWRYYYVHFNSETFHRVWDCLADGNKPWTKNASVLIIACIQKTFEKTGKNNGSAEHDLGMANAQLLLQANSMHIYGHIMGGFDKIKASELLKLNENTVPVNMIALGYLDEADKLEEPYRTRELTSRNRKELEDFSFEM